MTISKREAAENLFKLDRDPSLNIFQNKTVFRVEVLTPPKAFSGPATARTPSGVAGTSTEAVALIRSDESDPNKISKYATASKYVFMGRIINPNMAHEKFLEEPCRMATANKPEETATMVALHARIILATDEKKLPFQEGDVIFAECDPGDNNMLYDLQHMHFVKIDNLFKKQPSLEPCEEKLAAIFAQGTFDTLGGLLVGPELSSDLAADDEYVNITPASTNVVATLPINNFLDKLRTKILASEIKEIIITSGLRTPSDQARAIYDDRARSGCKSAITKTPAETDPCYTHYKLYQQKDLIMEVIRVDNDVSAMTTVFEDQVSRGLYLSPHMRGMGVDIRVSNLSDEQEALVMKRTEELGGAPVHEGDHIHVGIPDSYGSPQVS